MTVERSGKGLVYLEAIIRAYMQEKGLAWEARSPSKLTRS